LIYGTASTGTCSALFSVSVTGYHTLRSNEIKGDVRSFAWSPDGSHLHALDTESSSLLNFNISEDPNLQDLLDTKVVADTKAARQVIAHPVGHRLYLITRDTNELLDIPLQSNDRVEGTAVANRSRILVSDTPEGQYVTTSVAISSTNATLWTLSHTGPDENTFMVTAFKIDPVTGAVQGRVARASFRNYLGDGAVVATSSLIPAPFEGDMVAVTTYPGAMVAVLGLVGSSITAFGRAMLAQDEGCCGEGVWLR
jgi:6-phosphogluconolactonase (cycloisomerase 2 family)